MQAQVIHYFSVELFFLDNHTPDIPEYYKATPNDVRLVQKLLHTNYPDIATSGIQSIGKVNINSKNFRVGQYYVKVIKEFQGADIVLKVPLLHKLMRQAGIPLPAFVPGNHAQTVSIFPEEKRPKYYFYVQRFVDAHFYTGVQTEFEIALRILKRQRGIFSSAKTNDWPKKPYQHWTAHTILTKVLSTPADNSSFDKLVRPQLPALIERAKGFDQTCSTLDFSQLHHFDLHPHNFLFRNNVLQAVLDLESISVVPYEIATAFNIYKLARKAVATHNMTLEEVRKVAGAFFNLEYLQPFSTYELIRRLGVVLKLHYLEKNKVWDQDLLKHLTGLREADLIFTQKSFA
jgi:hypothetical protein